MAQLIINTGSVPNDKTGDSLRTAMIKVNNNFSQLFTDALVGNTLTVGNSSINVFSNSSYLSVGNTTNNTQINTVGISVNTVLTTQIKSPSSQPMMLSTYTEDSISFATYGSSAGNIRIHIAGNGNIGISNLSPVHALSVNGKGFFGGNVTFGNSSISADIYCNSTSVYFGGTANSAFYIGSVSAANVVSNNQLQANLIAYQSTAGLSANVATLAANSATYVLANNGIVSNSFGVFVDANTGLVANSSGLHATPSIYNVNSSIYVKANNGIVSTSDGVFVRGNTGLTVNTSGVFVNAAYVNTISSNNTNYVSVSPASSIVNASNLSANLANYVAIADFADEVAALNCNTSTNQSGGFVNATTGVFSSNVQIKSLGIGISPSGTTGEIRAINNITAYYGSDQSLKTNVKPIENAIEKLEKIRGVEFDWTDDYINNAGGEDGYFIRKHDVGVIAQEIESVLPEVVATREDGIKAVKYDRIISLLIQVCKEQQKQIDELKSITTGS